MIIEAVFILVPFFAGVAAGSLRARERVASAAALIAVLVLFSISVMGQPLLAAGLTTVALGTPGFVFGVLLTWWRPLLHNLGLGGIALIAGAATMAGFAGELRSGMREESVQTAMWVDSSPELAWSSLTSSGPIEGERPLSCSLDGETIGAHRTCHSARGHFEQEVIAWEPPMHLGLQSIGNDVPLQLFRVTRADSWLTPQDGRTHVLRSTDFVSTLAPAWFWRPIERLAVGGEQRSELSGLEGRFVDVENAGVRVRLTVSTQPPTKVTLIPWKGSNRPRVELGSTPLKERGGAFVGDTLLFVNEDQGIHAEESIEWGYSDELKVISKVFKKK